MRFKGLFKLSLAASVAVCANAAVADTALMISKFQLETLVW